MWRTQADVDAFLAKYNHSNNYCYNKQSIHLGDYVTIQDGTYNVEWEIAGFDCEYNRGDNSATATGWGIGFIPRTQVTSARMNATDTTVGGYAGSEMHTVTLPTIASELQKVLGNRMVNRRVVLSISMDPNASNRSYRGCSDSWAWYSSYLTLLSEVQVYGSCVWGGNYDVGEAAYKLPLFNYETFNNNRVYFWLRAVAATTSFALVDSFGVAYYCNASDVLGVRPLLYIS